MFRSCRTRVITAYFSNFWNIRAEDLRTNLTLSLILWFNLRLGGYYIWCASFIAPHIKEDLKTTRGMSTSRPRCSQGSIRKTPSRWYSEELEDAFRSTRKSAVLDYEEFGGLSDWSHGTWRTYCRIRDGTWPTPYTSCNYLYRSKTSRNRIKLPE
jgi:hypothetical protein